MTTTVASPRGESATRRPAPGAPRRRKKEIGNHSKVAGLFVAPFLLVFGVFTALPALAAFTMSFTDVGAADVRSLFSVNFVGLDTFIRVLTDPGFQRSVVTTAIFVIITVPVTMGIAFGLALILNTGIQRLKTFFRAAIYLPVITNVVAAAVIWQYAFTIGGPVNSSLASVGIDGPNWLGDPAFGLPTVVLLGIWRSIGTCMVLFLAGLQAIPEEVDEAASIDGASYWRRITGITLPLLRPTTLLITVLMTVMFLNIFEEPYLVTNGGPLGSTKSIALWVYEQFGFGNIAASMAGSFILLVLVALVAVVQFRMLRPKH